MQGPRFGRHKNQPIPSPPVWPDFLIFCPTLNPIMPADLRQRKKKAAPGADAAAGPDTASSSAFSQQQQTERERRNLDAATEEVLRKKRPSFIGRFLLFIGLPTMMGFCGMLINYLSHGTEGKSDASLIDFDKDFVFPFMRKSGLCKYVNTCSSAQYSRVFFMVTLHITEADVLWMFSLVCVPFLIPLFSNATPRHMKSPWF